MHNSVLKISFTTMPHALCSHTGSDIFQFVVFFVSAFNAWNFLSFFLSFYLRNSKSESKVI